MINIRLASKNDLKEIAILNSNVYNKLKIGEEWNAEGSEKLMEFFYKFQPDLFFVAKYKNVLVGAIVALVKPWWDGNHLTDGEFIVDTKYQRLGIGSKLLKKLFTVSKRKYKAKSWDTYTHRVHDHPLRWYKKIGFQETQNWVMISGKIDDVLPNLN